MAWATETRGRNYPSYRIYLKEEEPRQSRVYLIILASFPQTREEFADFGLTGHISGEDMTYVLSRG